MSAPVHTQDRQSQQASTPTTGSPAVQQTGMQSGPPPVPPTKPVLSSPGAYMANFTSNTTTPTAGIHSVNKFKSKQRFFHCIPRIIQSYWITQSQQTYDDNNFGFFFSKLKSLAKSGDEKPAIAARPIPPPTLPKYSSSFSKADRDRNEFGTGAKIDRAEREKVCKSIETKCCYVLLFVFV